MQFGHQLSIPLDGLTSSGTRPVAFTHRSVTGSVAALEAHAKAVVCAGTINFRYEKGFR